MSVNVSVRLDDKLAERLRLRARAAGETLSDRLRRYAEEGARRDEHPLITFRDGPAGRRAGLVGGPDVWEVALWVHDLSADLAAKGSREPQAAADHLAATLADEMDLPRALIDAALHYRAAYPDEIAARIELHRAETARADAM
ncbi:MAG TPA: ribbon-helix-helix protein, CopG family [Candidatus Limnocylindrales bacterium]|nr:ribbon-helix-helix protein, CopG family [Candidatus Limnocylindrales bacterium]